MGGSQPIARFPPFSNTCMCWPDTPWGARSVPDGPPVLAVCSEEWGLEPRVHLGGDRQPVLTKEAESSSAKGDHSSNHEYRGGGGDAPRDLQRTTVKRMACRFGHFI